MLSSSSLIRFSCFWVVTNVGNLHTRQEPKQLQSLLCCLLYTSHFKCRFYDFPAIDKTFSASILILLTFCVSKQIAWIRKKLKFPFKIYSISLSAATGPANHSRWTKRKSRNSCPSWNSPSDQHIDEWKIPMDPKEDWWNYARQWRRCYNLSDSSCTTTELMKHEDTRNA